ncbi:MAG TPA: response regulator, partial [Chthoniobacter sp.]|nr:response regulator [Chthoniobacter sp.]
VESEMGKGSRFILYFPLETAAIEAEAPQILSPMPGANAETLLVVEDEEVVRQLMCAVLTDAGYSVLCAGSPEEALRLASQHAGAIDLLVTDVVMPEMPGPELARNITAVRPGLKVLFVSGYSESDITEQGVVETSLEVLQKPFTKMALIRRVREMLDGEGKEPVA